MTRVSKCGRQLPAANWDELEPILEQFESAWQRGERPALDDYRCRAPADQSLLLLGELVHVDLERRLQAGEAIRVEAYLQAFPELASDTAALLSLIRTEHDLRRRREQVCPTDEYLQRFPTHRQALQELFAADSATVSHAGRAAGPRPSVTPNDPYATATPGAAAPRSTPTALPIADKGCADLIDGVKRLRLLAPEQQDQLPALAQRYAGVQELTQELVRREWLTAFQLNEIAQGRGRELVLDTYVLLKLIGQGGMGSVYKARQLRMDRVVALKVIRREVLQGPEAIERFEREARSAARLSHPNVVTVHDSNAVNGIRYLAMEYIEGTDLYQLLKQKGRLPAGEACEHMRQAALGLQHVHEKGLVHRDIKPHNLMRTNRGVIKVMDLGLARLTGETAGGLTATGAVMGTPDYIAPEQAVNAKGVDIRADIYSLGCSLYHLLAGRVPFPEGSLAEKLLFHQLRSPEALEQLCADLPKGLPDVVRKMMAKRREQRYQVPGEVVVALQPFCQSGGTFSAAAAAPALSSSMAAGTSQLSTVAPVQGTAPLSAVPATTNSGWEGFILRGIRRANLVRLARGAVWLLPLVLLAWWSRGFRSPFYIELNGFRINFWWLIGIGLSVRAAWDIAPALAWIVHPRAYPAVRGLRQYGSLGDMIRAVEAELADDKQRTAVGPAFVTGSWLVSSAAHGVSVVHLPDVTYAVLTLEQASKPKPGVTLRRRVGADVFIDCRGKEIDARCLLNEVAHRAPWVTVA